jgi:DNA-binding NarL/FixJ family response regulator
MSTPSTLADPVTHRIYIVDDHPLMRRGYRSLLEAEADLRVCGEAGTVGEALAAIPHSSADLVIVDITLGDQSGLDLIRHLLASQPDLPILVVSMHDEVLYGERVLRAGARGYLTKGVTDGDLVATVRVLLAGGHHLTPRMQARAVEQMAGRAAGAGEPAESALADRELEVYELLGRGLSTREVADVMRVSPKTVETYRGRIKSKLGLADSTELLHRAVRYAQERGLV